MNLGLRGIMDSDGDIHTWPTAAWQHSEFFSTLAGRVVAGRNDYRVRFRQWGDEPGSPIDFDPGATRKDMLTVCQYVAAAQGLDASDPSVVLELGRKSGVR
jgi:hypothetical protein